MAEKKVMEMCGMKGLYSINTYIEEEFWSIYDKSAYFKVKDKYDPNRVLSDVFQKVTRA